MRTIEQVKEDLESQFLCCFTIWTATMDFTQVQCWLDRDSWLWVCYHDLPAHRLVDCTGDLRDIGHRVGMAYSNVVSKSVVILRGDDAIMSAIVVHRLHVEVPG